jgi:hypothetical protein
LRLISKTIALSRHRWSTFQDMSADDIILFRGYDSDLVQKGEEFLVGYSAIRDPSVPDGMHRHSVEMRAVLPVLGQSKRPSS